MMKHTAFIPTLLVALVFAACEDDRPVADLVEGGTAPTRDAGRDAASDAADATTD